MQTMSKQHFGLGIVSKYLRSIRGATLPTVQRTNYSTNRPKPFRYQPIDPQNLLIPGVFRARGVPHFGSGCCDITLFILP
jgi:hypothetical protein